jgi:hypothetical protein
MAFSLSDNALHRFRVEKNLRAARAFKAISVAILSQLLRFESHIANRKIVLEIDCPP